MLRKGTRRLKEFLGIVFGLKRLEKLLIGSEFELQTDHKAIINLFKKRIDQLPNRLQRWIITIQHFRFSITYIKGADNIIADTLSRNSLDGHQTNEEIAEYTICFLLRTLPVNLKQVAESTAHDYTSTEIIKAIETNWPSYTKKTLKPFYSIRDQLSVKYSSNLPLIYL